MDDQLNFHVILRFCHLNQVPLPRFPVPKCFNLTFLKPLGEGLRGAELGLHGPLRP